MNQKTIIIVIKSPIELLLFEYLIRHLESRKYNNNWYPESRYPRYINFTTKIIKLVPNCYYSIVPEYAKNFKETLYYIKDFREYMKTFERDFSSAKKIIKQPIKI